MTGASAEPATPSSRALARRAARRARRRRRAGRAARRRAGRPGRDRGRSRPAGVRRRAAADLATACSAPGSGGPPAACSASRWRRSRAHGHPGDRPSRRATGRSPATSPPRPRPRRRRRASRGTAAARTTSLAENIDGMPEDDDLNFPLLALDARRAARRRDHHRGRRRRRGSTSFPAAGSSPPSGSTYRNLLDGDEPDGRRPRSATRSRTGSARRSVPTSTAGSHPAIRRAAARLAWQDGRLTHHRNGLYGAMFVAAACSAAVVGARRSTSASTPACRSCRRRAATPRRSGCGVELGRRRARPRGGARRARTPSSATCTGCTSLNNAALVGVRPDAQRRRLRRGDHARVVTGGWDTDSNGATVGSICGALAGAGGLPGGWIGAAAQPAATSCPASTASGSTSSPDRTAAAGLPRP